MNARHQPISPIEHSLILDDVTGEGGLTVKMLSLLDRDMYSGPQSVQMTTKIHHVAKSFQCCCISKTSSKLHLAHQVEYLRLEFPPAGLATARSF